MPYLHIFRRRLDVVSAFYHHLKQSELRVHIIGGDDILSNHPGVWDATAAAEQPTSGGSNADEHLVPLKSSSSDGTKILDIFEWTNNTAAVDKLWLQLKRSLREVPIVKRKSNGTSMMFLMPPRACELKELQKRCTKCFYYKEMEKFSQYDAMPSFHQDIKHYIIYKKKFTLYI
ncbi:unnamed protein product [Brassica rapa]|uniref:Uncharacterized protein n=1 Tax=Brassica campestris TaxID=3711 RepID=A0A8D9FY63_BRACM|nr:unnamed protein product [Brassica rapa]